MPGAICPAAASAALTRALVSRTAYHGRNPSASSTSGCSRTTPHRASSADVVSLMVRVICGVLTEPEPTAASRASAGVAIDDRAEIHPAVTVRRRPRSTDPQLLADPRTRYDDAVRLRVPAAPDTDSATSTTTDWEYSLPTEA